MYPSERPKSLTFIEILLENDKTEVVFNKSVPLVQRANDPRKHEGDRNPNGGEFDIQFRSSGFVGARAYFYVSLTMNECN